MAALRPAGSGPATELLVLVHGSYGRPGAWDRTLGVLEVDRTRIGVVATTSPGWGERAAEPVQPLTAAEGAADIAAQVPGAEAIPVHLVGFSMGAVLALELALSMRWELLSLTLVEPAISPVLRLAGRADEAERHADACRSFQRAVERRDPDPGAIPMDSNGGPGTWHALPPAVREALNAGAPAAARDAMMEADRRYAPAELDGLFVPTAIAHGSNTVPRLRHIAEALAGLIPSARLVTIDGADHEVLRTHPAGVAAIISSSIHSGARRT